MQQLSKSCLLAAMLCWVAPLSAERPGKPRAGSTGCPAARGEKAKVRIGSPVVMVPRSDFLGMTRGSSPARSLFLH